MTEKNEKIIQNLVESAKKENAGSDSLAYWGETLDGVIEKLVTRCSFEELSESDRKTMFCDLYQLKKAFSNY